MAVVSTARSSRTIHLFLSILRRSYATSTTTPPNKSRLGTTLSLEHFLQRGRVLSLYRTILRGTSHISDAATKVETRGFARAEFERHRGVEDAAHVRYLLSTGKTEWESMERYIEGM
ncbi:complex 1 LYR protein [Xylariaceae sp. FL0255]|nr:complex 1 LYR protein [Xylariaceae sp. FL0255]